MRTLAIVDGDLVMAADSYLLVSGPNKIKQDLYFALHEAYGGDPYHPLWGTVLGQYVGAPLTAATEQSVIDEVNRVVTNYLSVQADRIDAHTVADTRSTLTTSDVVSVVDDMSVQQVGPSLLITVALSTLAGQKVNVSREVS